MRKISKIEPRLPSVPKRKKVAAYARVFMKSERLMHSISAKINIVLCKSISRFAKNTVDLLEAVRHLKSIGVEVRFEKENISSMSGDGELMLSILASFTQEESRSISENCKWGIRKGFQNGVARFSLLYGYRMMRTKLFHSVLNRQ